MSGHDRTITIPTAMQQRLQWEPLTGTIINGMGQFRALLDVYCFATGKRYKRGEVKNERKEAKFVCKRCSQGYFYLRIRRRNARLYWWIVKEVNVCDCGKPSMLLKDLQSNNLTNLVGRRVFKKQNWRLLANACFAGGYDRDRSGRRFWSISCKRENCPGQINIEWLYKNYKSGYDGFQVLSAVDCCQRCKEIGNNDAPTSLRAPEADQDTCSLCCEQADEWVKFSCCTQQTCRSCFTDLVHSCPARIVQGRKFGRLLCVFDPIGNRDHFYSCPFCRSSYFPATMVEYRHRRNHEIAGEVKVCDLVATPYGYQIFDDDTPAAISTEDDYHVMEDRLNAYLRKVEDEHLRDSRVS